MEVPCQCLSSFPAKHPAVVLSILSSAPIAFTEQRTGRDDGEQVKRKRKSRKEKQVDGEEIQSKQGRGRRRRRGTGAASVKGHSVLQLDEHALRGTNKIVTAGPSLW